MNSKTQTPKNSRLYSTLKDDKGILLLQLLLSQPNDNISIQKIIKDDYRNLVFIFEFQDEKYIYKEPRERNQRKWERFLTLFRPSESTRFFNSHKKLLELGFLCPTPVISYEEVSFGMVIKSFFVYKFIEGEPATPQQKEVVFVELNKLHGLGYTRRDPNLNNFLINEKGIYFIDFKLSKPFLFKNTRKALEKIYFNEYQPSNIEPTRKLNLDVEKNYAYHLAKIFLLTKGKSNTLKNIIKDFLKKLLQRTSRIKQ